MFFTKFPSTKLQDVNLDWLLKKICKLRGGTANQVLAKASDADFDFKWITGGGGGGTSDYNDLVNQPKINNVTLVGNQSASDLGLLGTAALVPYRTAADQDTIDAAKQAKITANGMLKGDGDGGVSTATVGTDYLAPAALMPYRTAAAQDVIDEAQNTQISALSPQITARAEAYEIGIVITGALPAMAVSAGQYVIVRNSTISGITDGLYTAVNALSPGTNVTAADLTAVSGGGLNSIQTMSNVGLTAIKTPDENGSEAIKIGRLCFVKIFVKYTDNTAAGVTLFHLGVTPVFGMLASLIDATSNIPVIGAFNGSSITIYNDLQANHYLEGTMLCIV